VKRKLMEPEHEEFRRTFRAFVDREIVPFHDDWEKDRIVPRELWESAGDQGFLCLDVPEEYGGLGITDYRYKAVISEELARANTPAPMFALHTDIVVPYLLRCATDEQKRRWLPGAVRGRINTAIAMSEPAAGSDLQGIQTSAVRQGEHYLVNGQKTFISSGILADLVILVARTDPTAGHAGISLLVVERGMEGFERGRKLDKIGLHGQDTAELFFHDVKVPASNLLGEVGKGFFYLMENLPVERLCIAVGALATAEAAIEWSVRYCREREAFGKKLGEFQHTRFELAELHTAVTVARAFVDRCIEDLNQGSLTTETASMAKWWTTDLCHDVTDRCLQLFGGYGYMREYPLARAFVDTRVSMIYGGTNEIMKEIIGRRLFAGD
jgi:alkylation response protein AidB-like acyl-CoA dehydrogenase